MENKPTIEEEIVKMLRTVYDPEIPVNIYDLGAHLQHRGKRRDRKNRNDIDRS